jgi:hypothetical protein
MKGIAHRGLLAVAPVLLGIGCRAERMTQPPPASVVRSATIGPAVSAQNFTTTGSLNVARLWHTATLLNNGMVLIAGGQDPTGNTTASAELYNPATGTFTATGSMTTARNFHTATLLNNGMVLIAGGGNNTAPFVLGTAELYNPVTGTFTTTGTMTTARHEHTATLLNNGMVLIAGGGNETTAGFNFILASAELYDPATGTFITTGSMTPGEALHTATLLNNGMVLIAGGIDPTGTTSASAELYNPATGTFTATGSLNTARLYHTATLLNNGMALIAGGTGSANTLIPLAGAELYNPATGIFTGTGSLNTARHRHTATLLNNGTVLIAGGSQGFSGILALASAELYDPATATFAATGSLNTGRQYHKATLLNNGMVLITGGGLASAELYGTSAPTLAIVPPPAITVATDVGRCDAQVNLGTPTTAGGTPPIRLAATPAGPYSLGQTTVTWTATDVSGTTASATQFVTVRDQELPRVVPPPNVSTVTDPGKPTASVSPGVATATDNCPGVTVTGARNDGQALNAPYPVGQTIITWTATDASANKANASQSVTVADKEPPTLGVPADFAVNATSPAGAVVTYEVIASDNVAVASLTCSPASGTTFPIGTTSVTCVASDPSGNRASATFHVTVLSAQAQISNLETSVTNLALSTGTTTSLLAKFNDALAAANAGDVATACASLQDFINETQAQAGKKISISDANMLSAAAQRIRAALGC